MCSMSNLRRTKQGQFDLEKANTIEDIKNNKLKFYPVILAFDNYPIVKVDKELEKKIMDGCILDNIYNYKELVFVNDKEEVLAVYGIYDKDSNKIKTLKTIKNKEHYEN